MLSRSRQHFDFVQSNFTFQAWSQRQKSKYKLYHQAQSQFGLSRTMPSSSIDRSETRTLLTRGFSNRDNSFITARNLGRFTSRSTRTSIRATGVIGPTDPRDVVKATFAGVSVSSSSGRLIVQGGTLSYSVYIDVDGRRFRRQFGGRLAPGTYPLPDIFLGNSSESAVNRYIVFDRPTGNVRYDYRETYQLNSSLERRSNPDRP